MLTRVRKATTEIRDELQAEYRETVEPLQDLRADLEEARRDLQAARDELAQVADDVVKDVEEVQRDIDQAAKEDPPDVAASDGEPGEDAPAPAPEDGATAAPQVQRPAAPVAGLDPLDSVREELKAARQELEDAAAAGPAEEADGDPADNGRNPAGTGAADEPARDGTT